MKNPDIAKCRDFIVYVGSASVYVGLGPSLCEDEYDAFSNH